jgi:hypothetical protein
MRDGLPYNSEEGRKRYGNTGEHGITEIFFSMGEL